MLVQFISILQLLLILFGFGVFLCLVSVAVFIRFYPNYRFHLNSGSSMYPILPSGLKAVVITTEFDTVSEGDIVTYFSKDHNSLISHSVYTYTDSDSILTKGIANEFVDPYRISQDDILYKSVLVNGNPIYIPLSFQSIYQTFCKLV